MQVHSGGKDRVNAAETFGTLWLDSGNQGRAFESGLLRLRNFALQLLLSLLGLHQNTGTTSQYWQAHSLMKCRNKFIALHRRPRASGSQPIGHSSDQLNWHI